MFSGFYFLFFSSKFSNFTKILFCGIWKTFCASSNNPFSYLLNSWVGILSSIVFFGAFSRSRIKLKRFCFRGLNICWAQFHNQLWCFPFVSYCFTHIHWEFALIFTVKSSYSPFHLLFASISLFCQNVETPVWNWIPVVVFSQRIFGFGIKTNYLNECNNFKSECLKWISFRQKWIRNKIRTSAGCLPTNVNSSMLLLYITSLMELPPCNKQSDLEFLNYILTTEYELFGMYLVFVGHQIVLLPKSSTFTDVTTKSSIQSVTYFF